MRITFHCPTSKNKKAHQGEKQSSRIKHDNLCISQYAQRWAKTQNVYKALLPDSVEQAAAVGTASTQCPLQYWHTYENPKPLNPNPAQRELRS